MELSGFVKGTAAGIAIGVAAALLIDPISDKQKNKLKKQTHNMFKNIGCVMDTALDIIK